LDSTDAAAFGIEAAAIDSFWAADASNHTDPGNLKPSLGEGEKSAIITAGADAYTLVYSGTEGGWDAVSALFMSDTISNDVMLNPVVNGATDWVVTFPTKKAYVYDRTAAKAPFSDLYAKGTSTKPLTYAGANLSCEAISLKQWNREESTAVVGIDGPIFSPQPPAAVVPGNSLCLETNTLAMGAAGTASVTNTVLAGTGTEYLPASNLSFKSGETEGWMRMSFSAATQVLDADSSTKAGTNGASTTTNTRLKGLPVMGFAAFKYVNGDRTFGFVSDHKTTTAGSAIHS
jgi:hypothetical protein